MWVNKSLHVWAGLFFCLISIAIAICSGMVGTEKNTGSAEEPPQEMAIKELQCQDLKVKKKLSAPCIQVVTA